MKSQTDLERRRRVCFAIKDEPTFGMAVLSTFSAELVRSFDPAARTLITTTVSELGRNILKYAGQGVIELWEVRQGGRVGVEVIAQDSGPGIPDISQAMGERFSTGGTLGLGLPGVRRMMDEFGIQSDPGNGTRVTVRKWRPPAS